MLPAYAGMIPKAVVTAGRKSSAPRVCGDDPTAHPTPSAPRRVLPAYAGMIRVPAVEPCCWGGAPRVCGDDPCDRGLVAWAGRCSPRMRG